MQKITSFYEFIIEIYIVDFRVPWSKGLQPFLATTTQKQVTTNMTEPPQNIRMFCIIIQSLWLLFKTVFKCSGPAKKYLSKKVRPYQWAVFKKKYFFFFHMRKCSHTSKFTWKLSHTLSNSFTSQYQLFNK